jgi:SAM-dependent methyltransferase
MEAMGFFARNLELPASRSRLGIDWQETSCLLCNGANASILLEAPDRMPGSQGLWFVVVQCQECGLCFTNPRPSPRSIGQFYPVGYGPHHLPRSRKAPRWRSSWRAWWNRQRNERKVLGWHGQGRLLDFGCGGGSYLERMHLQGWKVTGLDLSTAAVQRIRSDLGLHALTGSLPHPALAESSFDVITMWQSLEHVHNPLSILREAQRLLVPGGKLIVSVPNIDSLPFRWFGQAWSGLDLPRHLTHFAPWTLRLMLNRAGFHAGKICMIRRSSWLRASARFARRQDPANRGMRWLCGKLPSTLAAWYSACRGLADCMMVTAHKR